MRIKDRLIENSKTRVYTYEVLLNGEVIGSASEKSLTFTKKKASLNAIDEIRKRLNKQKRKQEFAE